MRKIILILAQNLNFSFKFNIEIIYLTSIKLARWI